MEHIHYEAKFPMIGDLESGLSPNYDVVHSFYAAEKSFQLRKSPESRNIASGQKYKFYNYLKNNKLNKGTRVV